MSNPYAPQAGQPGAPPPEPGRPHSRAVALLLALVVPGAGQAYNGQPIKGVFLLMTSVLVLPWLFSLLDAFLVAGRLARSGGRYGKGGCIWIFFHLWFVLNVLGLVLIGLTVSGVMP